MTAPSFILSGRSSDGDLHRLARPIPIVLAQAAPEQAEAHELLARRLGEATATALACRQRLAEAQAADDAAGEKAIREGQPMPRATKSEKARASLDEAERELRLVRDLIPTSAQELLVAVQPHAADVAESVSAQADELEVQALARLDEARELFIAADTARVEAAFAAEVAEGADVRPFTQSTSSASAGLTVVDEAKRAIEHEAERRRERQAEYEHELFALNVGPGGDRVLPLPPVHEEVA